MVPQKNFGGIVPKPKNVGFSNNAFRSYTGGRLICAHRLAWELKHKKRLPSKFTLVLHTCTNAKCVNPDHLYIGTPKDIESRKNNPERFWERVDKKNGPIVKKKLGRCWIWTGGKFNPDENGDGYGQVQYRKRSYPAHRLAWLLTHGSLSPELLVCHKCDIPSCVRPSHLFLGSAKDNTDDMIAKGRKGILTPEGRERLRKLMTGNKHALGSKSRTGQKLSQEEKDKIGNANRGRKHTPETIRKIKKAMKGNSYAKGYKFTEEQKAHLREVHRLRKLGKA